MLLPSSDTHGVTIPWALAEEMEFDLGPALYLALCCGTSEPEGWTRRPYTEWRAESHGYFTRPMYDRARRVCKKLEVNGQPIYEDRVTGIPPILEFRVDREALKELLYG